jgi:hypothetical protein
VPDKATYKACIFMAAAVMFTHCEKHSAKPQIAQAKPGASWTIQNIPIFGYWRSIVFGNGKFVAVGANSDTSIVSSDGNQWEKVKLPWSDDWQSITFGNGIFVAMSQRGGITTSTDGISWVNNFGGLLPGQFSWDCVTFGKGIFVAVQQSGLYDNGRSTQFATSNDGLTWTTQTVPSSYWHSVTFGDGTFVAVSTVDGFALMSSDGAMWGNQITIGPEFSGQSVVYGNGLFVAGFGVWDVGTSPDGINWSLQPLPPHVGYTALFFGGGLFVALSQGVTNEMQSTFATSSDGVNWTGRTVPLNGKWNSVAYGNGVFVAVAEGSAQIAISR